MTDALRLRRLDVRRTPGISDAFSVDGLADGVTLIHGPNGCGKSSTARAITAALWPREDGCPQLWVSAEYQLGGSTYVVSLDAGRVRVQRDGANADPPALPAPELRQRYQLSLHDLMRASDDRDDFAAEVVRQSAGGYDLAAAANALGFRAKPSAATSELKEWESARNALKDAQQAEARLHAETQTIAELEQQRDAAAPAQARARALELAIRYGELREVVSTARTVVAAFPTVLATMRGTEQERLEEDRRLLQDALEQEGTAEAERDGALQSAAKAFPDGAPRPEVVAMLREEARAVQRLEATLGEAQRRVAQCREQLERARMELGDSVDEARLATLDAAGIGTLTDFARGAEQLEAKLAAADAELQQVAEVEAPKDLEVVRDGLQLLRRWLEAEPPPAAQSSRRWATWALAALAATGFLALAIIGSPFWLLGALSAIALALVDRRDHARQSGPSDRSARERDYSRLGLPAPAAWTSEAVIAILHALCERLRDGTVAQGKAAWRTAATHRRAALADRWAEVELRRTAIVEQVGVAPDFDVRRLAWLVERIGRWQDARRQCEGAEAELGEAREQLRSLLEGAAERLRALGYDAPSGASALAGYVQDIEDRVRRYEAALDRAHKENERLDRARARRAEAEHAIVVLCESLGLAVHQADDVASLCERHAEYLKATAALRDAERDLEQGRRALEREPAFKPELLDASPAELGDQLETAKQLADDHVKLAEEVSRLRERVDAAKQGHQVADALARLAAAQGALEAARARDLDALVGHALQQYVHQESRDRHRPEVFRRARELFATITRGRYQLELVDGADGAEFRAVDVNERGFAKSLDELSSATRVQLLIAVRVAFVETQEQGVRLPLLLDETLGTSDDVRAQAIIEAVSSLAAGGRQVFYFTAQQDEVRKWKHALDATGVAYGEIDLAARRRLAAQSSVPVPEMPIEFIRSIPTVDGHSHESFGKAIGLPPLRVRSGCAGVTHLWYLIDDLRLLDRLLRYGVETLGQLETLLDHGGAVLLGPDPSVQARVRAMARAVEVLHEQAAIGRGKVVDRAALIASGAVSDRKLDDVMEVVARVDGEATSLLRALEAGEVKGFQLRKTEELREYLAREGYLTEELPRSSGEIRTAVLGALASELMSDVVRIDDIDRLMGRAGMAA